MREKINNKLNEVFNKLADEDCPMWCELASPNGLAYLTWHKYQDNEINLELFKAVALVILTEFKSIDYVQCPWWGLSRESLMNSIAAARTKAGV